MVTLCQKKLALFGVTMTYQGTGGRRKNIKIISDGSRFLISDYVSNKYVINSSLLITGIQTKYELLNLLWTISDHLLHCLKDSGLGDIYDCWILILFNISMFPDDCNSCYISYHLCVCKSAFNESVLIQGVQKWRLHRIWL